MRSKMASLLARLLSVKNHKHGVLNPNNQTPKFNQQPRKGKIIIRRKITNKPCNTNPKTKPLDN